MNFKGVYAITDSTLLPGDLLVDAVTQALEGGISLLQYRNKTASWQEKLDEAKLLQNICASYAVPLIINDDVRLCQDARRQSLRKSQESQENVFHVPL